MIPVAGLALGTPTAAYVAAILAASAALVGIAAGLVLGRVLGEQFFRHEDGREPREPLVRP
jgi:membrane protein DedA with SNARE-associated domain